MPVLLGRPYHQQGDVDNRRVVTFGIPNSIVHHRPLCFAWDVITILMRKLITLRKSLLFSALALGSLSLQAQLTLGSSPYTQDFDAIGSGLPAGWTVRTGATAAALGTSQTLVTSTSNGWTSTTAQFRNAASSEAPSASGDLTAVQATRTDRVPSVRQSGTFGDPGAAFVLEIANTVGLSAFDLSFKLQSLDVGSARVTTWRVDYGFGVSPTSFTAATTSPATLTTGGSTFTSQSVTVDFGSALDGQSGPVWIRVVTVTSSTGSGNRPTTGIDDFNLTYSAGAPNTSVQFTNTNSTVAENAGTTNLALNITNFDASNATNVTIAATGATGRITTFTTPVSFPANSGNSENCVVSLSNDLLCNGNEVVTFTITGVSGRPGVHLRSAPTPHMLSR